jgi:hypothetical protein
MTRLNELLIAKCPATTRMAHAKGQIRSIENISKLYTNGTGANFSLIIENDGELSSLAMIEFGGFFQ